MLWDKPLDNALCRLKDKVSAPVRLVLWDGREIALSEKPRVTVRLKGLRAASVLVRPVVPGLSVVGSWLPARPDR